MTTSVTIGRTSLSLSALSISSDGTGTYSLTPEGLGRPVRTARSTFADPSPHVEGQLLTQSVADISSIPFEVVIQADSAANLEAAIEALEDALFQFRYVTTVTVDGVGRAWTSQPCGLEVVGGAVLFARRSQFCELVQFTIPVLPTPEVI